MVYQYHYVSIGNHFIFSCLVYLRFAHTLYYLRVDDDELSVGLHVLCHHRGRVGPAQTAQ